MLCYATLRYPPLLCLPPLRPSPIIHKKQPHSHKTQPGQTRKRPSDAHCVNHALQERDRDGGQGAADHVAGRLGRGGGSMVLVYEEGVVDLEALGSWVSYLLIHAVLIQRSRRR